MLRQITAIFLFVAFAAQIFDRGLIMLDYYANTPSFVKNCENKARPMMHCNGKCQMMKRLKEEEKKDQQNPERRSEIKNEVFSSKSFFATISFQRLVVHQIFSSHTNASIQEGFSSDIFQPPGLV